MAQVDHPLPASEAILAFNSGASSLKFALFSREDPSRRYLSGASDRLGQPDARLHITGQPGAAILDQPTPAVDHETALPILLEAIERRSGPAAACHPRACDPSWQTRPVRAAAPAAQSRGDRGPPERAPRLVTGREFRHGLPPRPASPGHAPTIRSRICSALEYLGIRLDTARNERGARVVSGSGSTVTVDAFPTEEESIIKRDVVDVLGNV